MEVVRFSQKTEVTDSAGSIRISSHDQKRCILDDYLYGSELPDNGGVPDGIGNSFDHHVYFHSTGDLQDNVSTLRARTERNAVMDRLGSGEDALAAMHAGIMSHYVVDLAVFGHVMGSSTDWGSEVHHSDYENYVRDRTTGYVSGEFDPCLALDNNLGTPIDFTKGRCYIMFWLFSDRSFQLVASFNPRQAFQVCFLNGALAFLSFKNAGFFC